MNCKIHSRFIGTVCLVAVAWTPAMQGAINSAESVTQKSCQGITARLEFLTELRAIQQSVLKRMKPGSQAVYRVEETNGSEHSSYRETWTLIGKDSASGKVQAKVERSSGSSKQVYVQDDSFKVIDGFSVSNPPVEAECSFPFMYAHSFKRGTRQLPTVGNAKVLEREQFSFQYAKYREIIGEVPFGKAESLLEVQDERSGIRRSKKVTLVGCNF